MSDGGWQNDVGALLVLGLCAPTHNWRRALYQRAADVASDQDALRELVRRPDEELLAWNCLGLHCGFADDRLRATIGAVWALPVARELVPPAVLRAAFMRTGHFHGGPGAQLH